MREFNYEKAWIELAAKDYDCLPRNVRDLVELTFKVSAYLHQGKNLDMPWPTEEMLAGLLSDGKITAETCDAGLHLRERFAKTPAEDLAWAAHVVYFYGHWAPCERIQDDLFRTRLVEHEANAHRLQETGGCWKFSNYADQELTQRVGLVRDRWHTVDSGISWAVLEGMLRVGWSSYEGWRSLNVGWATKVAYKRLLKVKQPVFIPCDRANYDKWNDYVARLKATGSDDRFVRWTSLDKYMEDKS